MDQPLIQLSQGQLTLLSLCPRKYQYTYRDQLFVPTMVAQNDRQEQLGRQFHLLMQQYWMGLEIEPILQASPQLQDRFRTFQAHPPQMIEGDRLTEHRLTLKLGAYLLVGIFDLLVMGSSMGQIIDWKSYRKPKSSDALRQSWQTKLYLYLLAETRSLDPEQISMTYWFSHISPDQDSHTYTFQYSQAQHHQTAQTLSQVLEKYDQWRETPERPLPQVSPDQGHCIGDNYQCAYLSRCGRSPEQIQTSALLDIDAIPEVPLSSLNPSVEAG